MSTSLAQATFNFSWGLRKTNPPFADRREGPNTIIANLGNLKLSIWDQVYEEKIVLSDTNPDHEIDLQNWTDVLGVDEVITLQRVIALAVIVDGSTTNVIMGDGASDGLGWFQTNDVILEPYFGLMYTSRNSTKYHTVDATHKTLKFALDGGSGDATITLGILGSTIAP